MKFKGVFLAAILTTVLCISGNLLAYSSGTGEPNNPYKIANVADFQQLTIDDPNWNKSFILTANLNFGGLSLTPVGNGSTPFTGVFNGNNNIISNAVINQPDSDYVGLFGWVGSGGQIRNLGVENVNITGSNHVGGLVGYTYQSTLTSCYATGSVSGNSLVGVLVGYNVSGTLTSCYATGSVTGNSYAGGLVGYNYAWGTLTDCYATGSVTGTGTDSFYVGGLVGENSGTLTDCYATGLVTGAGSSVGGLVGVNTGTLTSCYATGLVSGVSNVGGLVGYNSSGSLTSCYATGSVTGNSAAGGLVGDNYVWGTLISCYATGSVTGTGTDSFYVGGLVGDNSGTLTSCYATGSVTGTSDVGGLVGVNTNTLTNCYATGSVSGNSHVGGLVGYNVSGTLTSCYATGSVTGTGEDFYYVGGLVGLNYGSINGCFWDINTSSQTFGVGHGSATGVTGKTTTEMQTESTFTNAGWDFVKEKANGTEDIWHMPYQATGYPMLYWQRDIPGDFLGHYGVNFVDYVIMAVHWGQIGCPTGCEKADINNDGTVDINDLMFLADNWLAGI